MLEALASQAQEYISQRYLAWGLAVVVLSLRFCATTKRFLGHCTLLMNEGRPFQPALHSFRTVGSRPSCEGPQRSGVELAQFRAQVERLSLLPALSARGRPPTGRRPPAGGNGLTTEESASTSLRVAFIPVRAGRPCNEGDAVRTSLVHPRAAEE